MSYLEKKFVGLVSRRLRNFKEIPSGWNFSCLYCGDSKTDKTKARGYLLQDGGSYRFYCHNCSKSDKFYYWLRSVDPILAKDYNMEKFVDDRKTHQDQNQVPVFKTTVMEKFKEEYQHLQSINRLDFSHPARKYIEGRKIPQEHWNRIYYTEDFMSFMDTNFPDHGKKLVEGEERIVTFFRNYDGFVTHVSGRALDQNAKIRYMTIKVSTVDEKMFGLDLMDVSRRVYLVEGQFDSMFLPNCVAAGDGALAIAGKWLLKNFPGLDLVLVPDNQPMNLEICKLVNKMVCNFPTVIWPSWLEEKDLNDIHCAGFNVQHLVEKHTYSGLEAELKFGEWRKWK